MPTVPLRTIVITRGSHPQAIDNHNDYLLVIAPDASAQATLIGLIKNSHAAAEVAVMPGKLTAFDSAVAAGLRSAGVSVSTAYLSFRQENAHAFVFVRAAGSGRPVQAAILDYLRMASPSPEIGGRGAQAIAPALFQMLRPSRPQYAPPGFEKTFLSGDFVGSYTAMPQFRQ